MAKPFHTDQKNHIYSLNTEDTRKAIRQIAETQTIDATRELIQLYFHCLWRETQIDILNALSMLNNQRSIEFLFEIASSDHDLALAEIAIESLGKIETPLVGDFLISLFENGSASLKSAITLSLADIAYVKASPLLFKELKTALIDNNVLLIKNLLFALGELKYQKAKDDILSLILNTHHKDVQMSALQCLGKISRDVDDFTKIEDIFKDDAFEKEIFKQAKNQAQFRSQWSLEDYLIKIYGSQKNHKNIAFELNAFNKNDVLEGLSLLSKLDNLELTCTILSKLSHDNMISWYEHLFKNFDLSEYNVKSILNSLSYHTFSIKSDFFIKLNQQQNLFLHLSSHSSPNDFIQSFFISEDYFRQTDVEKIMCINHLANYCLAHMNNTKSIQFISQIIETELYSEKDVKVKGRWIRLAAQSKLHSNKLHQFLKQMIQSFENSDSVLYYCEKNAQFHATLLIKEFLKRTLPADLLSPLFRSISQMPKNQIEWADIKKTFEAYQDSLDEKTVIDVLKACQKHAFIELKSFCLNALKNNSQDIQLHALVALKHYDSEDVTLAIEPFLKSQINSLQGRALDSILHHSSIKSKRLAFDFMIKNSDKDFIVEKVCRHLMQAQLKSDYFIKNIYIILSEKPDHPYKEELTDLKNKISEDLGDSKSIKQPSAADLIAVDKVLLQNIIQFNKMDETVKSALRSAELHFVKPEVYENFVDVSACILGYSKAIDLFLEKHLGKKLLNPRLETRLHEFQNLVHITALNTDHPVAEKVLKWFDLEKQFSVQSLPLHKMTLIGKGLMSSKVLHESHKILDGLRAWAIVLILFCRTTPVMPKPLISLNLDNSQIINLSKKLMWLQDLRNPVAHRQTLTHMDELKNIRKDIYEIINLLEKSFI